MAQTPEIMSIRSIEELEDILSEPTEAVIHAMAELKGDLLVLGIGGKMGPTLARMAKRASELAGVTRRVIGVSRFCASSKLEERLHSWGVEIRRGDLLDAKSYSQ